MRYHFKISLLTFGSENHVMAKEITLNFQAPDGSIKTVDAVVGDSIMETAIKNDVDEIVAECGGSLICATCHIYVSSETAALIDAPDDTELDMLEGASAERRENSRLSCQVIVSEAMAGHTFETPDSQ